MRKLRWVGCGVGGVLVLGALVLSAQEYRGVGHYDQVVVVETSKAIRRVTCCDGNFDEHWRGRLEGMVSPPAIADKEAKPLGGNRFACSIRFTTRDGLFRHELNHHPHLAVCVEYVDGTGACRVVDLPPGRTPEPVVVRIP